MAALQGKVALVTGGASGIGLATVRRLKGEGARVASVDVAEPREAGTDLHILADVGDAAGWPGILERVETQLGGLDIVYLNAGMMIAERDITAVSDEQYRRIMGVNVDGVFFGLRAAAQAMQRRGGGGQIVATASLAGIVAFDRDPVYTATKHFVVGLIRSVAAPLEAQGIHVAAVCPGIVDTPLVGTDRTLLREAGFPMLSADDVAGTVMLALQERKPGACYVVQPGREPVEFNFPNVPGPRTPGAVGVRPPI